MNVNTNRLVDVSLFAPNMVRANKNGTVSIMPAAPVMDVGDAEVEDLEPVPDELQAAAKRVLAGRPEAYVSKTSGGKLSRWASARRKERSRQRAKMAKASRRRNRR